MRVLSLDPGAVRGGLAVIELRTLELEWSSVESFLRKDGEAYQDYRMRLIEHWAIFGYELITEWRPDIIVSEIVPARGFNNPAQSLLARDVSTIISALAFLNCIDCHQISASEVKKKLTGDGKATKVKVRNRVIEIFPELAPRKMSILADESDAIAIGLVYANKMDLCKL